MKHLIESIIRALDKTLSLDDDQKAITEYALYNVLVTLAVVSGLTLVSLLLGLAPVAFTALCSGAAFRWSMGGAHYSRPSWCILASIAGPIIMAGLASYASQLSTFTAHTLLIGIILVLFVFASAIIYLYCPAETENNPLPERRKPQLRRISYATLIMWLAIMLYLLRLDHISLLLASCLALVRQLLSVTPVGFRMFLSIDSIFSLL
jgi:accessory gene regulator B